MSFLDAAPVSHVEESQLVSRASQNLVSRSEASVQISSAESAASVLPHSSFLNSADPTSQSLESELPVCGKDGVESDT